MVDDAGAEDRVRQAPLSPSGHQGGDCSRNLGVGHLPHSVLPEVGKGKERGASLPASRAKSRALTRLPRKNRALASHVTFSAYRRQAERGIVSARRQAACRSSSSAATGAAPMTSCVARTGKPAIGNPLASASSNTRPNVSVRLENTKTSALA